MRRGCDSIASSHPRLVASSPHRILASSHPRLIASSPRRILASSHPRLIASSPHRILASSHPRLIASSPHRILASSHPRLIASSPHRILASSPTCKAETLSSTFPVSFCVLLWQSLVKRRFAHLYQIISRQFPAGDGDLSPVKPVRRGVRCYSNPLGVVVWSQGFSRIRPPKGSTPFS